MFAGKILTDFVGLFSPYDFEKIHSIILISKMNEIDRTNLNDQAKFILNEISKTENYSNQEINQRKRSSKKLSKYVVTFDYIDKV